MGLPDYYEWRTRSGCYFCFFQRKIEWVGLMKKHPDLFQKAKDYEKHDLETDRLYTWSQGETLEALSARAEKIVEQSEPEKNRRNATTLMEMYAGADDEFAEEDRACIVCDL